METLRSLASMSLTTRSPMRSVPSVTSSRPAIRRRAVVLPQPLRPEQDHELAVEDLEGQRVDGGDGVETLGDVLEDDLALTVSPGGRRGAGGAGRGHVRLGGPSAAAGIVGTVVTGAPSAWRCCRAHSHRTTPPGGRALRIRRPRQGVDVRVRPHRVRTAPPRARSLLARVRRVAPVPRVVGP